jgi:glycine/D-amino acid oxidase-like deaminating enzyme
MTQATVFHPDFVNEPYWWGAFRPGSEPGHDLPASTAVAIVGGGFTGLSMALELRKHGREVVVLESQALGHGASTRNGGGVSGGVNVGKTLSGRKVVYEPEEQKAILGDAAKAYGFIEDLIVREGIDCKWQHNGRFVGAWTPKHYAAQAKTVEALNASAKSGSYMVPRERQHEEIASDLYFGGQIIGRSACLHPALLYQGMLQACIRAGVVLCAHTPVTRLEKHGNAWRVHTGKGVLKAEQVAVATNAYTTDVTPHFKRRIVPISSHIIVTEPLPAGMAQKILPTNRMINDTLRVRSYYRLTPDGTRVLFGGRGRFGEASVEENSALLHKFMVERMPDTAGVRISHAWSGKVGFTFDGTPHMGEFEGMYYAMGCNGSGVAMLSWLGYQTARKIVKAPDYSCAFDRSMPGNAFYTGTPWFLPMIGSWFRVLDKAERAMAGGQ